MKNKMYSRSDVVEKLSKLYGIPCRELRSHFKRYGWNWRIIWPKTIPNFKWEISIPEQEAENEQTTD